MTAMTSSNEVIRQILDEVGDNAAQSSQFSVGDLFDIFGRRAYGPAIAILGLVAMSPVGAIPGASLFLGAVFAILALQYGFRDAPPTLPHWVRKRSIDGDKIKGAIDKLRPYVEAVGVIFTQRFDFLTQGRWTWLTALVIIGFAMSMFPLALVPAGAFVPASALTIIGFSIAARDGLILSVATVLGAGTGLWLWL